MEPATPPPDLHGAEVAPRPPLAATDIYPRDAQERELCDRASGADWLYMAVPPFLVAGAIVLDSQGLKYQDSAFVRTLGPASVGLTWGFFVGGFYLALPKCSPHWVPGAPPEGDVRATWPMAIAMAMFAGATAPIVVGIETGPLPTSWTTAERAGRVVTAGLVGFGSALLPYVLPPKTWRAAKELQRLRATVSEEGAYVSWGMAF